MCIVCVRARVLILIVISPLLHNSSLSHVQVSLEYYNTLLLLMNNKVYNIVF